jgi:FkbM family methyltransferase
MLSAGSHAAAQNEGWRGVLTVCEPIRNYRLELRTGFEDMLIRRLHANLTRLGRRLLRDYSLIRQVGNWREVLKNERHGHRIVHLHLRNGVVLDCPEAGHLWFIFHEIWVSRLYEAPGYRIGPAELAIDVGANVGVFATFAATRARDVRVMAFEPFPQSAAQMRKNVRASGLQNIQIQEKAVAGKASRRYLNVVPQNWIVNALSDRDPGTDAIEVECTTLDDILETGGIECCDLLKMDCEGAEYEILQQASSATLGRIRRIVMEYHEPGVEQALGTGICAILRSRGFVVDRVIPSSGCGIVFARNAAGPPGGE